MLISAHGSYKACGLATAETGPHPVSQHVLCSGPPIYSPLSLAYFHALWTGRPPRGPSSKLGPSCCPLKNLPS